MSEIEWPGEVSETTLIRDVAPRSIGTILQRRLNAASLGTVKQWCDASWYDPMEIYGFGPARILAVDAALKSAGFSPPSRRGLLGEPVDLEQINARYAYDVTPLPYPAAHVGRYHIVMPRPVDAPKWRVPVLCGHEMRMVATVLYAPVNRQPCLKCFDITVRSNK